MIISNSMSYTYWEQFFQQWLLRHKAILGWNDPDVVPLLNTLTPMDLSSDYVPEPWWGNDGGTPLHSVVMNYNPGKGASVQRLPTILSLGPLTYAQLVKGGHLPLTGNWHFKRRALPILQYLQTNGLIRSNAVGIESHLSVELIPWHTESADKRHGYQQYVSQNLQQIFENCFIFAANESKRIVNNKLRSTVIIRKNFSSVVNEYLAPFQNHRITGYRIITSTTSIGSGKYSVFELTKIKGVRFVCIWGPHSRNNFPPQKDLNSILDSI